MDPPSLEGSEDFGVRRSVDRLASRVLKAAKADAFLHTHIRLLSGLWGEKHPIPAVTKGCRTWRIGVPIVQSHTVGTKKHPFVTPGLSIFLRVFRLDSWKRTVRSFRVSRNSTVAWDSWGVRNRLEGVGSQREGERQTRTFPPGNTFRAGCGNEQRPQQLLYTALHPSRRA